MNRGRCAFQNSGATKNQPAAIRIIHPRDERGGRVALDRTARRNHCPTTTPLHRERIAFVSPRETARRRQGNRGDRCLTDGASSHDLDVDRWLLAGGRGAIPCAGFIADQQLEGVMARTAVDRRADDDRAASLVLDREVERTG